MSERRDVVIAGAGLLGLAAGRVLARRGLDVVVLDQAPVGHAGGGSKGSCRVFRYGYEDPLYVDLVRRARECWADLEHTTGERLLHPTPQLTFGEQMPVVHAAMRSASVACDLLRAPEAAERFPGVASYGDVLLEPDSAVIAAEATLAALARTVPDLRTGVRVRGLRDDGRRVLVTTDDAGRAASGSEAGNIEAASVIVAAGPWTAGLLATAGITMPSRATAEQVAYLAPAGPVVPSMPIFIHHGAQTPYGLPVPGADRYKIGLHHDGVTVDPDRQDQAPDAELSARIERAARQFLPAFDPRPVAVERCVYDNSPDTDFIVDRIGNVVIGAGTSGHGFKFGPLFGEWLASLAAGPARPDSQSGPPGKVWAPPARFALSRFLAPRE